MNNQIYRIRMSDDKTLEFYICDTNEVEPYKETKEMSIVLIGKNMQIDATINQEELASLIKYLKDCGDYIDKHNAGTKK